MLFSEINPFLRTAELQPSVMSQAPHSCAYDHRLFYILEGECTLMVGERRVALCEGSLVYLRPGTPYYFEDKVKIIVLNFDLTRAYAAKKEPMRPRYATVFDPADIIEKSDPPAELREMILMQNAFRLEPFLQECVAQSNFPTSLSDGISSAAIKWILCEMVREIAVGKRRNGDLICAVTLYIQKNYNTDLSNAEVAAAFGYHPYYLNKLFKEGTGKTMHQALLEERVVIAENLLKSTALSVEEIALETGFSNRGQFCMTFKKQTGKTPGQYRGARVEHP